jgi:hypothetical protein
MECTIDQVAQSIDEKRINNSKSLNIEVVKQGLYMLLKNWKLLM